MGNSVDSDQLASENSDDLGLDCFLDRINWFTWVKVFRIIPELGRL